jgi:cell division protein FtsA
MNNNIVVGLDIGTNKVCALIAKPGKSEGELEILGIGITESEGLTRGVISNIEKTVKTINIAIEQAEQQSGIKIKNVVVGIAGDHIESFQTRGIIGISSESQEITQADIDRLLANARNVKIPSERRILHVMAQEFIIDGQDGISDPIGMSGVRLEAEVHIITGLETAIKNIYKCVERCGLIVDDVVLEPIASSRALLTDEEKEVGVGIIDIGGGTTDIAVFEDNIIRFSSIIGIAGHLVTEDVRKGLGIIAKQAERIKREYGHSYLDSIMKDEVFMIPGIGGRKPMEVSKSELCRIIQPRMEELFEFSMAELSRSGFLDKLGAGLIITGGTCLLKGSEDLAREIFGVPVKLGIPTGISYSGLAPMVESPVYSTGVGLALIALDKLDIDYNQLDEATSNQIEELSPVEEVKVENNIEKENQSETLANNSNEDKNYDEDDAKDKNDKPSFMKKMKTFIEQL